MSQINALQERLKSLSIDFERNDIPSAVSSDSQTTYRIYVFGKDIHKIDIM